jgi:hypothetical protein
MLERTCCGTLSRASPKRAVASTALVVTMAFCFASTTRFLLAQNPTGASSPGSAEIIQGIDNAVRTREGAIAGYTVQDHYAIYRNGEAKPSAEMTVQTVYKQGVGKTFTTLSQSGSGFLRSQVIEKIIAGEKEMSTAAVRETVLVTSANYEMTPDPAVRLEGAPTQSPSFFAGDSTMARDYSKFDGIAMAVRAEAHSHSFLLGDTVLKIESTGYQIQRNP